MKVELSTGENLFLNGWEPLGAVWAVAKAFNLYPPVPDEIKNIDLIGRFHHKFYVVYQAKQEVEYKISLPVGAPVPDYFIMVTGKMPIYVIHGYSEYNDLVEIEPDNKGEQILKLFHHTLTAFSDSMWFWELLDNTRVPMNMQR